MTCQYLRCMLITHYSFATIFQGRINDIGLLVASTVERDDQGRYTTRGEALLDDVGNYTRLFHVFCWSKFSKQFQVLSTSTGMSRMLSRGILSQKEYKTLTSLSSSNGGAHNACLTWILIKCLNAMKDETLPDDHALRDVLLHKLCGRSWQLSRLSYKYFSLTARTLNSHPFFSFKQISVVRLQV
jgi:hypothetical protein